MSLYEKLRTSMQNSLRAGDRDSVRTLRTLLAKLKEGMIAKGSDLSEDEESRVLQKAASQRREAIELYRNGGREDLATAELSELVIIESYLPEQLTPDELATIVDEVIQESGATSLKDMAKVMPILMRKTAGRTDGKMVQQLVREKLTE
ncbi:MAG: GatB/YqeY domain-containing protein [Candidatus Neomarinimicrobiota bacterium]